MVANIPFNPNNTTVMQGAFDASSYGLVQGDVMPDPAIIYKKASGFLAQSETLPMWAGVGIYTDVPNPANGPLTALGSQVGRATSLSNLLGFSVASYGQINSPQSPVPLAASGMQVQYFRLGSGARLVLQADSALASLEGGLTNQLVSWDFVNQKLIPYVGATAISSGTYNGSTGLVTLTLGSAVNLNPGDTFTVSSATGTGSFASINGTYQAGPGTTGATVTYTIATGLTLTITGGSLATSGALPVQILRIESGNSQTINYNTGTGFASWNFSGTAAVCLI